jgi:hypothetical protein
MPTLTATLTLDLSGAQSGWQAVKADVAALPAKVQAVQATIGGITVTGQAGPSGTVSFDPDTAQTDTALADLHVAAQALVDHIKALQGTLASLPVTVTNVA